MNKRSHTDRVVSRAATNPEDLCLFSIKQSIDLGCPLFGYDLFSTLCQQLTSTKTKAVGPKTNGLVLDDSK